MKKLKNIIIIIVIIFITIITFGANQINAQSSLPLIVAPARQQLEVNPGEQTAVNIKFYNSSDLPVSGILRVADFIVEDKQGSPKIIDNPIQASPKYSASTWFTLPYDRMSIPATDKVIVQTNINVPINALPGGRYVAIYFEPGTGIPQATSTDQEAGTSVGSRIVGLVYLRVSGNIKESALISRFFAPSFFEYGPIKIETDILNRGDYHIRPRGVISLINAFGGIVDQVKLDEQNVFPDASRSFINELGRKWMIGRYKISFLASYGDQGQVLEKFNYVWVFPWRVAVIVLLAITIIVLFVSNISKTMSQKQHHLEKELEKEKEEIEKLKQQLRKRSN